MFPKESAFMRLASPALCRARFSRERISHRDALQELIDSIRQHGIIQPLIVQHGRGESIQRRTSRRALGADRG